MRQYDTLQDVLARLTDISTSPLTRELIQLAGEAAYSKLVIPVEGSPEIRKRLESVQPAPLITQPVRDADSAQAMLAGLWLWHDWLEPSHTISQSLENPTGSFW